MNPWEGGMYVYTPCNQSIDKTLLYRKRRWMIKGTERTVSTT